MKININNIHFRQFLNNFICFFQYNLTFVDELPIHRDEKKHYQTPQSASLSFIMFPVRGFLISLGSSSCIIEFIIQSV